MRRPISPARSTVRGWGGRVGGAAPAGGGGGRGGGVGAHGRGGVIEARRRGGGASLERVVADEAGAGPLRADGVISTQEYEQVRLALEVARARRDQLRIELDRAAIRAPFDGSVAARLVDAGNYVRPGAVMFRLVQDDPLKFRG